MNQNANHIVLNGLAGEHASGKLAGELRADNLVFRADRTFRPPLASSRTTLITVLAKLDSIRPRLCKEGVWMAFPSGNHCLPVVSDE
jgi:hypothetical protein